MNEALFKNWLRASYGFKYLKQGLSSFIENHANSHHNDLKQRIDRRRTNVQPCSDCTLENLMPDHGRKGCHQRSCFCYRSPRLRRPCPVDLCSYFHDLIVDDHAFNSPRWSDADPTLWYCDWFQYTKCFLGTNSPAKSIDELDCTGLISVVINNRYITNSVDDVGLFIQCREDRNEIFHTSNFEVTDAKLLAYIDNMINVLNENCLKNDQAAQGAINSLNKLKADQIHITDEDIVGLRQEAIQAINDLHFKVKHDIIEDRAKALEAIDRRYDEAIKAFNELKYNAVSEIGEYEQKAVHEIIEHKDDILEKLTDHGEGIFNKIKAEIRSAIFGWLSLTVVLLSVVVMYAQDWYTLLLVMVALSIVVSVSYWSQRHYRMQDINASLRKSYKSTCQKLKVTPLLGGDDEMELLTIYQFPELHPVPYHRTQVEEEDCPINNYHEIFSKGDNWFRNIYITGDAGVGKTSFCQCMAYLWYLSQSQGDKKDVPLQRNIDFMTKFDFVFYVSLRETEHVSLTDMIVDQFFYTSSKDKREELIKLLENILQQKECLIILDGLDEWSPSTSSSRHHVLPRKIRSEQCTYLITCRPYKLENIRLSEQDIDHHIKLTGIPSFESYVRKIAHHINLSSDDKINPEDFFGEVQECGLEDQLSIPMIVSQLLMVWLEHKLSDMPRARIYCTIVDMLFERAEGKQQIELPSATASILQLPASFSELIYLKQHASLLEKVCFLSFWVLFNQGEQPPVLVFTTQKLLSQPFYICPEEVNFLCKLGILSKNKVIGCFGKREHKMSFLHKSYIEFLAALYVSSFDTQSLFNEIIKKWNSLIDVLPYSNFFIMLAGLSYQKVKTLLENIHLTLKNLKLIRTGAIVYHDNTSTGNVFSELMLILQNTVISCVKEVRRSIDLDIELKLEDFVFENFDDEEILTQLLLSNITDIKSLYLPNGRYLREFNLIRGLQCLRIGKISSVFGITEVIEQNESTLHSVGIEHYSLIRELPLRNLRHLSSLSLSYVRMQHESLHGLMKFLSDNVLVRNIKLQYVACDNHPRNDVSCVKHQIRYNDCTLSLNLQNHELLNSLILEHVKIVCSHVNNASLKYVILSTLYDYDNCYADVLKCIESSGIEHLCVYGWPILDDNTMKTLMSTLSTLQHIKTFRLFNMRLPDDILVQIHLRVTEAKIKLDSVKMSDRCFCSLIDSCVNNKSALSVELYHCYITTMDGEILRELTMEESADYMFDSLMSLSTIKITFRDRTWIEFKTAYI